MIPGSSDYAANYERVDKGVTTLATIYVYPPNSTALDASFPLAKAAVEIGLKGTALAQSWSEGPFRVVGERPLVGNKVFYKIGIGPDSSQTSLYLFETGRWNLKIRITVPKIAEDTTLKVDGFVRALPWQSLALTDENCTGSACRVDRALAVHGMIPEMLAALLSSKLPSVFADDTADCNPDALASAFTAPYQRNSRNLAEPVAVFARCSPKKGMDASFVRMVFPDEMASKIEMESPDGITLRRPISFVILRDQKSARYTEMHDGTLASGDMAAILARLNGNPRTDFATADRDGRKPKAIIRFIE